MKNPKPIFPLVISLFNSLLLNITLFVSRLKIVYKKIMIPQFLGFAALLWFLIRVIPKPSRASYPCQQAAFPLASAFVLWLAGLSGMVFSFNKVRYYFQKSNYWRAASYLIIVFFVFVITQSQSTLPLMGSVKYEQVSMVNFNSDSISITPKAYVSIVRSEKANAEDIDSVDIHNMVKEAVTLAGGFEELISDNDVVVLKPNLLTANVTDNNSNPTGPVLSEKLSTVTTDYRVIQAVVNLVREKNPNGKIYIMEGSGIGNTRENMQKLGWLKVQNVDDFICLDEICEWDDSSSENLVQVSLPTGKALYSGGNNKYIMHKIYYEADVLISIPVLKTHCFTAVTGAVKNVGIGATPVNIYGTSEDRQWRYDIIDHSSTGNYRNLNNFIHDFYMCKPVDYAIMDCLTGMENGPQPMTRDQVTLGKKNTRSIMASKDAVALDAIESLLIKVDPARISHLVSLNNDSLGCADPVSIRVLGKRVDEVSEIYRNRVTYANHNDNTAPTVSVIGYELAGDTLSLNLSGDSDLAKVEISIDNNFVGDIFVSDFDNIKLYVGGWDFTTDQVTVNCYDKYLNCTLLPLQTTGCEKTEEIPSQIQLYQNYPNPFNPATVIRYSIPHLADAQTVSNVSLRIYDLLGNEVATLVDQQQRAGYYEYTWNAGNVSSGIYFCVLNTDSFRDIKKMILLK